ncbi:MAG: septal ring lytic transglycosylase RlpA family protein [Woeseia sp.]
MLPERGISTQILLLALSSAVLVIAGCAGRPAEDDAPGIVGTATVPPDPVVTQEPRSRYGNGPYYRVLGQRYEVMGSAAGYREQGVASWYGKKFHGKPTSSQEPYDMYAMTAAHKTLPLPSYVRVTNLRNNKSVVVRVNDRGPFVANRIIDLSYAAALKLDMIRDGTSLVEVTVIEPSVTDAGQPTRTADLNDSEAPVPPAAIFVQAGAFGDVDNARRQFAKLRDGGVSPLLVHEDVEQSPALYRVRIGPIADVTQYDSVVEQLQRLGISETHLVTE